LPKLATHELYVQALCVHEMPVAFFTLVVQFVVQLPHCATLFDVLVSQPVFPAAQ
jgi:hypothetical protein